jgi:hypothetical protein
MNALALKQRIRDRLRQRKFELEILEHAYRSSTNQAKLDKHTQQRIKRQEPGIQTLARKYNKLCTEMVKLIDSHKTPQGVIAPLSIETDGLFKLDVDDDIWQDIGLTDDHNDGGPVPAWLGDDKVRAGIKSLLEHDRCMEEERRLIAEKLSMFQWFREEWAVTMTALNLIGTEPDVLYQIDERRKHLLRLCVAWEPATRLIPNLSEERSWGPTVDDLAEARNYEYTEEVLVPVNDGVSDGEESNNSFDSQDIEDADLMDQMEESAITDDLVRILPGSPMKY